MNPLIVNPVVTHSLRIGAQIGSTSVSAEIVGASVAASSASTVILATGGAAALVLLGYGIYKHLNNNA